MPALTETAPRATVDGITALTDWRCLLCDATLARERYEGSTNVFLFDCEHCHSRYCATGIVVQRWPAKTEDEKARIRRAVERANARHATPHLSPV
jgi:hypothetical protein